MSMSARQGPLFLLLLEQVDCFAEEHLQEGFEQPPAAATVGAESKVLSKAIPEGDFTEMEMDRLPLGEYNELTGPV